MNFETYTEAKQLEDIARITFHPFMLASLHGSASLESLRLDELYLKEVMESRIKSAPREVQEVQGVSKAAIDMGKFIQEQGSAGLDIVVMVLANLRVQLREIFKHCSKDLWMSSIYEENDVPLVDKGFWKQRFVLGDLDEGESFLKRMQCVFAETLVHQKRVFDAALSNPKDDFQVKEGSLGDWVLCTDFDDTCTTQDTTSCFVRITGNEHRLVELMQNICDRMDGTSKVGMCLRDYLKALETHEKMADEQVIEEGLLEGITKEDIEEAAADDVKLRHGCGKFLRRVKALGNEIHVVSSNWSQDLIRWSLPSELGKQLVVHSNDLSYDCNGVCDGKFTLEVRDSSNKEEILQRIREENGGAKSLVFIGDSINDLLALMDADLGIVVGRNERLLELCNKYSIQVLPLQIAALQMQQGTSSFRNSNKIFRTSGWAEIEQCLFPYEYM